MKRLLLFVLISLYVFSPVTAQQQDEVLYRLELGGGAGMGLHFSDVEGQIGAAAALLARFPLNPRMAIKTQFDYGQIKGSTDGLKAFYPANPDAAGTERLTYSVSNAVYSLSALYELHFLPYGYERGYQGYSRITPYIQAGFGLAYGPAGKGFTAQIPIGVGVKYKAGPRLNLGLDWTAHFSLSDKLDGLKAPLGIKSSGFRNKDHYGSLLFTITYDLAPVCPTCNRDD